jgi:hypothetical protein
MSFTKIALEGSFQNPDGSPASGTLCAVPDSSLRNYDGSLEEMSNQSICGVLDASGRIVSQGLTAFVINATDDTGTVPVGAFYTFTLKLDGQDVIEFSSPVPSDPATFGVPTPCVPQDFNSITATGPIITLVDLIASPSMVGQSATCSRFASGNHNIIDYDPVANTITLDVDAESAGVCDTTINGGAIYLACLQGNDL